MPFDNSLKNMQTPGRVHALCKLLLLDSYTPERLMDLLQPDSAEKEQVKSVYKLALNGGLIEVGKDNKVYVKGNTEDILDPKKFEQYIGKLAFEDTNFVFGRFTAWVMARGGKVLNETKDELSDRFFNEVSSKTTANRQYNQTNILAWMTWANYFGLGHTMNGMFVPNPFGRVKNFLLRENRLSKNEFIPIRQFIKLLGEECPELDGGKLNLEFNDQFGNQQLSFALSLGLRTLHDLKIIELKNTRDVEDIWYLQEVPTHEIRNQVTDIMVKG